MKVLFLTHYSQIYGANLSMLYLAEDLKNRYNIEPIILCPRIGELALKARELGIIVFCSRFIAWRADNNIVIRKIARCILNPLLLQRIIKLVENVNPDIIHSNSSVVDLGVLLSKKTGIPCVWHLREFGVDDYNLSYLLNNSRVSDTFHEAKALIAVSEAVNRYYCGMFSNLRVDTIYNGVKIHDVSHKSHEEFSFCCVGRISPNKGQFDLLRATNELVLKGSRDFHVFLAGDGGPKYVTELKKYVESNGLNEYVSFCGKVEDVFSWLGGMDVGIMASKREAFGRVTVEYMQAELPIIATESGGTKEILGDLGQYYTFGDFKKLALLMEMYKDKRQVFEKLGQLEREIAIDRFSQARCTDEVYALYTRVLCDA